MRKEWEEVKSTLTQPDQITATEEALVGDRPIRVFSNAPSSLRAVFSMGAMLHSDKVALVCDGKSQSYNDVDRATVQLANGFVSQGAVKRGDRIALCLRNCPEWIFGFWATVCVGGVAVAVNSTLHPSEMAYCLTDSDPTVVIVDAERATQLASFISKSEHILWIVTAKDDWIVDFTQQYLNSSKTKLVSYAGFVNANSARDELPSVEVGPDDDASILYTSGTTGKPKGVLTTHRSYTNALFGIIYVVTFYQSISEDPNNPPEVTESVTLHVAPFFHTMGLVQLPVYMLTGAKTVLLPKWNPVSALKLIEKERVTSVVAVPTMFSQMLAHPVLKKYDISSLQRTMTGAAPTSTQLLKDINSNFKAVHVNGYGLTETTSTGTTCAQPIIGMKPTSVGIPSAVTDIMIVESSLTGDGLDLTKDAFIPVKNVGRVGEIAIRGPSVFKGYWKNAESSAKVLTKDGWFVTGDVGRLDEDGCLYIMDRAKDMLIRGGENVFCAEVESAVCQHPQVLECAVIGVPHASLGETVCAVVVLKDSATKVSAAQLISHCKKHLALYKCPSQIEFWDASELPKNAAGKVLKKTLKAKYVASSKL
ncbi:hypothetical protein HDU77_003721 [Chytriomyces hyalinus]|nr:hypothetical protein HDU77_003721 [Chytriomyces hyalinus]